MKSILLYNKEQASKNKAFIDIMLEEANKHSLEMSFHLAEELNLDSLIEEKIDFIINRQPDYKILQKIENLGIKVYNNSEVCRIANDKALSYQKISNLGVDILETKVENIKHDSMKFPYILKPRNLRGGEGVTLIKNIDDYKTYTNKYDINNSVQQELASDIGKDLRVYIIGNKIVAAMLRESKDNFKSNYSLGSKAIEYKLSNEEKKIIEKIISSFDFDYVGIDFLFHNGKLYFNELEDPVGARMLYSETNINPASLLVKNCVEKHIAN